MTLERSIIQALGQPDAPRIARAHDLACLADRLKPGISRQSVQSALRGLVQSGLIQPVTRGLYMNMRAVPRPTLAECAQYIRSGAIVSLATVLGDAGVLNNPSRVVTCLLPVSSDRSDRSDRSVGQGGNTGAPPDAPPTQPRVGEVQTQAGRFCFHGIQARLLSTAIAPQHEMYNLSSSYPRATAEKALMDTLYLSASSRSRVPEPPLDCDLSDLDRARMQTLAQGMGLETHWQDFLQRHEAYQKDHDVEANMSITLGF